MSVAVVKPQTSKATSSELPVSNISSQESNNIMFHEVVLNKIPFLKFKIAITKVSNNDTFPIHGSVG
jgi:hypothetical protein